MEILIGNAFPMTLIRRHSIHVEEIDLEELRGLAASRGVKSFWGHENTRRAAEAELGVSLKPPVERPVITLDVDSLPALDGVSFRECYVLSPEYRQSFRPAIGAEVALADIVRWHALRLQW